MSILDLVRRAGDIPAGEVAPGILIFGPSGNGKTHSATVGGRPFVLLMERNGIPTIRRANPNAGILLVGFDKEGKPLPREDGLPIVDGKPDPGASIAQVRNIVRAAMNGELRAAGYDRLVVDSLTELQRLFIDVLKAEAVKKKEADSSVERTVANDEDGEMSLKMWGVLGDRMQSFLRSIRALPIPVICTALVEDLKDNSPSSVRPLFKGKTTAVQIAQFFSAVGFVARRNQEAAGDLDAESKPVTVYRTMFDGPARYAIKSCGPVSGVIEPDPVAWISAISSVPAEAAAAAPAAKKAKERAVALAGEEKAEA